MYWQLPQTNYSMYCQLCLILGARRRNGSQVVAMWTLLLAVVIAFFQLFQLHTYDNLFEHKSIKQSFFLGTNGQQSNVRQYYDACVVGAGLSGAVIAERFASQLGKNVLVLDSKGHIGGRLYDFVDKETGILVQSFGPHLLQTDSYRVWQYAHEFSDWEPYHPRFLAIDGGKQHLSINMDDLGTLLRADFDLDKLEQGPIKDQVNLDRAPANNVEEAALARVGKSFYDRMLKPYLVKKWGKSPIELDVQLSTEFDLRRTQRVDHFADVFRAVPLHGYTALFETLFHRYRDKIHVKTNVDFFDVRNDLSCGKIIYTEQLDSYFARTKNLPEFEHRLFKSARRVSLNTTQIQPTLVVNHPDREISSTRTIEYKHMYKTQLGLPHTVYFVEEPVDGNEIRRMDGGVLDGGDTTVPIPIPNKSNKDLYMKYISMAEQENITFVGNDFRTFDPAASILDALEKFDELAPRVLIASDLSTHAGGVEALVQLAIAFHSWMPTRTYITPQQGSSISYWKQWYPSIANIPQAKTGKMRRGDVVIYPEVSRCPSQDVQRGVKVYIWWLARRQAVDESIRLGCGYLR